MTTRCLLVLGVVVLASTAQRARAQIGMGSLGGSSAGGASSLSGGPFKVAPTPRISQPPPAVAPLWGGGNASPVAGPRVEGPHPSGLVRAPSPQVRDPFLTTLSLSPRSLVPQVRDPYLTTLALPAKSLVPQIRAPYLTSLGVPLKSLADSLTPRDGRSGLGTETSRSP